MTDTQPVVSVLVPTRNRPDNVRRLVESAHATAGGVVQFVFYVDDDDPQRGQVQELASTTVRVVEGPRVVLSECWNRCAEVATADILMHCGDDIVFRTPNWDKHVAAAFDGIRDRIALVHGRDGVHDAALATHGFIHRRWMETVGYMVPPFFASDFNDLWLTEVADALGRRIFLPEVYTEHMHPAVGKGELDQTHQERLERHRVENCDQIWTDTAPLRAIDVEKLRAVMD